MNIEKKMSLIILTFFYCTFLSAQPSRLELNKWIEDVEYLRTELPKKHLNAFHSISKDSFNNLCIRLEQRARYLPEHEIILELRKVLAAIGDGHTNLFGWENGFHRFPFRFFRFSNGYFVTRADSTLKDLLGAKLLKVGPLSIDSAFLKATAFLPKGEGEMYLWHYAPVYLSFSEFVSTLGLSRDPNKASFTFQDSTGRQFTVAVKAIKSDSNIQLLRSLKILPLYLQNLDKPFWYQLLPKDKIVYFNFSRYTSYANMLEFSGELLSFVEKNEVKKLVIDMRYNQGGDESMFQPFIEGLIRNDSINKKGRLFVVTGRATYSAGLINAAQLKLRTNAILIGEPTGSNPNQYNESAGNQRLILPNSKLIVDYAIRFYKLLDTDFDKIIPDIRVDLSSDQYNKGADPVLQKIIQFQN